MKTQFTVASEFRAHPRSTRKLVSIVRQVLPIPATLAPVVLIVLSFLMTGLPQAHAEPEPRPYRTDRIIIQPKSVDGIRLFQHRVPGLSAKNVRSLSGSGNLQIVELTEGTDVGRAINEYEQSGLVEFAEPDYLLYASSTPDDPDYAQGLQWGLNNIGQLSGVAGADIDAAAGWEVQNSAEEIIVAVIDTGIRHTHEDLAANMWRNKGEIAGNGLDDDSNGVVDDVHGLNAITNRGNPRDDSGHGTHVAGIIGAVSNNGKGISGVAWRVQLMACKFMDSDGVGSTSDAIQCIDYARRQGAKVINASWGGGERSLALERAIKRAREAGIVFVAAAGNESADNDITASYPCNYNVDNIVVVAASNRRDQLDLTYSNYGRTTVDLAAPGTSIYSSWHTSDRAYMTMSGTSMATPFVSGAIALMTVRFPDESPAQLIGRLLNATDALPGMLGKCVSGGRINLRRALGAASPGVALQALPAAAPNRVELQMSADSGSLVILEMSENLRDWTAVGTYTVPAGGQLSVVDPAGQNATCRFYRTRPATGSPGNPPLQ